MASQEPAPSTTVVEGGEEQGLREVRAVLQAMRVVFRSIQAHSRWVEKRCGVSAAQLWALWEIHVSAGLRVSELAKALAIHQSTASNLLDKLEDKGLMRRERGGPDQRVVRLYLTEKGQDLVARAPRPAQGALIDALGRLPKETLAALGEGLETLLLEMKVKDQDSAMEPLSEK